jgi:hypothetical protein
VAVTGCYSVSNRLLQWQEHVAVLEEKVATVAVKGCFIGSNSLLQWQIHVAKVTVTCCNSDSDRLIRWQ